MKLHLVFVVLVAAAPGCVSVRDVTRSTLVQQAGIVGKTYALTTTGYLDTRHPELLTFRRETAASDAHELPEGTRIEIIGVRETRFKYRSYVPRARILSGSSQGRRVSVHYGLSRNVRWIPAPATIGRLGPTVSFPITEDPIEHLASTDWNARFAAAEAVRSRGLDDSTALHRVAEHMVGESDPDVRWRLLSTIDETGAREVIPQLVAFLHEPGLLFVESTHLKDLLSAQGAVAVPPLRASLRRIGPGDDGPFYRITEVLFLIGADAKPAIPDILAGSRRLGQAGRRRLELAGNIGSIDRAAAIELATSLLHENDARMRLNALLFLEVGKRFGALDALPEIERLAANDVDSRVRLRATRLARRFRRYAEEQK